MKISYLNAYHALRDQAFVVSDLVDKLERKDFNVINDLLDWLKQTEKLLKDHQFSECAQMAALRSKLLHPDTNPDSPKKISKRKLQWQVAPGVLMVAQDLLTKVLEPLEGRIEEAREAVNQLLGIAYQNQLTQINDGNGFHGLIQSLWTRFSSSEQLRGGIAKVLTLVNQTDGIRLMAEEIEISKIQ